MIYIFSIFTRLQNLFRPKPKEEAKETEFNIPKIEVPKPKKRVQTQIEKLIAKINGAFSDLLDGIKTGRKSVVNALDLWLESVKKLVGKSNSIDGIPPSVRSKLMDYFEKKRELEQGLVFIKTCPPGWEGNKKRMQIRAFKKLERSRMVLKVHGNDLLGNKLIPTLKSLDKKRFANVVWRLDQIILDIRSGMDGILEKKIGTDALLSKIPMEALELRRIAKTDLAKERVVCDGAKITLSIAADKIESDVGQFCNCLEKYVSEYLVITKKFGTDGYDWIEFEERRLKIIPELEDFGKFQREFLEKQVFFLEELNQEGLEQTSSLN